jgi:hypothetical protein
LDTAYTLALLQEEAAEPIRRKDFRRVDSAQYQRHTSSRGTLPLPPPAARPFDDKAEQAKLPGPDDKFASLKSFRRARGLCMRCGEKWTPGHRCSATP